MYDKNQSQFLGQALVPVSSVKDLGIVLDSHLTFNEHVTCLTSSLLSTLCQISRVRYLFSRPVLLMILNSLVFSKLFYCSTVWAGIFKQNLQKLQLVQNFAARIVTNTNKFDHITPVLRELQWPSVKSQLEVRDVPTLLYKIINGLAPAYLANKIRKRSFSFPEPSFLLVTWSAKRRALVAATTGCREISDIR